MGGIGIAAGLGALLGGGAAIGAGFGQAAFTAKEQYRYARKTEQNRYKWMRQGLEKANLNPILGVTKGLSPGASAAPAVPVKSADITGINKGMQAVGQFATTKTLGAQAKVAKNDAEISDIRREYFNDPNFVTLDKAQHAVGQGGAAALGARGVMGLYETLKDKLGDAFLSEEEFIEKRVKPNQAKSVDDLFEDSYPLGAEVGRARKPKRRKNRGKGRGYRGRRGRR